MIFPMLLMLQAVAGQIDDPYSLDAACTAEDMTGMIECQKRDLSVWDAPLNDEYQKALGRVGAVSRQKLKQARNIGFDIALRTVMSMRPMAA